MALLQEAAQEGLLEEVKPAAQALASAVASQVSLSCLSFTTPQKECGTDCSRAGDLLVLPVWPLHMYHHANVKGPS